MENEINDAFELIQPPPEVPRRSHGKIPRLPHATRTLINQSLRDGLVYSDIISKLDANGFPGITPQNLSYWYQTGYKQWLTETERFEAIHLNADLTLSLARELQANQKESFNDFAKVIVDSQITQVLQQFDPQRLTELLADRPDLYFSLANLLSSRSRDRHRSDEVELKLQKYRDHVAEQKRILDQATKPKPGGITPESLAQIRKALNTL